MRLLLFILLAIAWPVAQAQFDPGFGNYKEGSKNRLPSFTFSIPFNGEGMKEEIAPIRQACIYLNKGFGGNGPKWQWRTCTLVKYLATPKTLVEAPDNDRFSHFYTPRRVGKEKLRFVIAFGEQHIDVTCVLHTEPYEH